ncbi:MAG: D-amino-acid transaminase [Gammaproteobacteria bacterium]|nr:D-amino-acid transaminase [Gammaproteobacteria bacterium]
MSRIVYVNGAYVPEEEAKVSIFDRGFLFADGVYEVSSVIRGRLVENRAHLRRLHRSLAELEMASPASDAEIESIQYELIARNGVEEGIVYLQVTRGAADRDFKYPVGVPPTLVMFTQAKRLIDNPQAARGIAVITTADIRWARRDIKTVGLLASCMAKMIATAAGADDAWMVENGFITEGSSNNAYIVSNEGVIITRQLGHEILHGITRRSVLKLAEEARLQIDERPFTVAEALAAKEAFLTSASTFVMPVTSIDGIAVGEGRPGPIARQLRKIYIAAALADTEK